MRWPGGPSSDFPDYIGVESCADMRREADEVFAETDKSRTLWRRRKAINYERKEYPPLIPLLAWTENLHSYMPWVLTRHYTPDGRLILTEEKVRHHEYFRAHRHNGRLTLQLVPLDDEVLSYHCLDRQCNYEHDGVKDVFEIQAGSEHPHQSPSTSLSAEDQNEQFHDEVMTEGQEEEEGMKNAERWGGGISCGGSSGNKFLNYNSVGVMGSPSSSSAAASCVIGMPLPALRQVHS